MEGETLFSFLDFGDEGNVVAEFFSTSGAVRRKFGADFGQVRRVRLKCRRGVFFEERRRPSLVRRGFWTSSSRPFKMSSRSFFRRAAPSVASLSRILGKFVAPVRKFGALALKRKQNRRRTKRRRKGSANLERSGIKRSRKKIKNANRRNKRPISTVARIVGRRSAPVAVEKKRRRGNASLFLLTERKNAQRGDASAAKDENNIHQRVRFTERNAGGKVEEENKENDRRKGRRSDAKEFGHIAVPKGLRR